MSDPTGGAPDLAIVPKLLIELYRAAIALDDADQRTAELPAINAPEEVPTGQALELRREAEAADSGALADVMRVTRALRSEVERRGGSLSALMGRVS